MNDANAKAYRIGIGMMRMWRKPRFLPWMDGGVVEMARSPEKAAEIQARWDARKEKRALQAAVKQAEEQKQQTRRL